jgi:hypothetical protein
MKETRKENKLKNRQPITSGLAQAGAWLARKFVRIFNICARANDSETPAFAKPPGRCVQCHESVVERLPYRKECAA